MLQPSPDPMSEEPERKRLGSTTPELSTYAALAEVHDRLSLRRTT